MKKYIILLFIAMFSIITAISQGPPPPPSGDVGGGGGIDPGFCPCCEEQFIDPETGAPSEGQEGAYDECKSECAAGNNPCAVPIDSALLLLLLSGAGLGIYFTSKKNYKKRIFEI